MNVIKLLFFILCLTSLTACETKKEKKVKKKDKQEQTTSTAQNQNVQDNNTAIDCDTTFWKYVYNPERLQVIDKCKTVTGIIEERHYLKLAIPAMAISIKYEFQILANM